MALKYWKPLAEQGNAEAQFNVGLMYYEGDGVEQDYAEAAKWFSKASEKGHPVAQFSLGVLYIEGHEGWEDYVQALMWFMLAARRGEPHGEQAVEFLVKNKKMARAQIAKAEQLAQEWLEDHKLSKIFYT